MRNRKLGGWRKTAIGCLSVTLLGGLGATTLFPSSALAVSGATKIRVGLLLNNSTIQTATDTVTLQGRSGLSVGFYTSGTFTSCYSASGTVQDSLDNYYVIVGEYSSLSDASSVADRVDNLGYSYDIYVENRSGQKIYQVIAGYYEARTTADAVAAKIASSIGGGAVKGYFRLTTGLIAGGQSAAVAKANELNGKGIAAYPVVRKNGTWEVWIGNEGSSGDLAALKSSVAAKTGATYSAADYSPADYLIIKKSVYGSTEVPHVIQESDSEESAFVPSGDLAVTKVMERGEREYRGSILVRGYKTKPNVINYVGLDEYLYGVLPQEMATGWPTEALKAQAVAARTYAARRIGGNKWGVADLSDDVWDQAYRGYSREADDTTAAVIATKGQVLTKGGDLIDALFSSNNGGYNGDAREMWGSNVDYLPAVDSSFDKVAADKEPLYDRVQLSNGMIGWMRADAVNVSGKNDAGFQTGTVSVNGQPVRVVPDLYAKVMTSAVGGTRVVILDQEKEYNEYNWQRGPYSPSDISAMINENQASGYPTTSGPVYDLQVSKWGQGNRVMQITADGKAITVPNPDYYRALFSDMWSTRITIEQQGTYTVQGASSKTSYPSAGLQGKTLNVISANGTKTTAINGSNDSFVVLGAGGKSRVVKKQQSYIIHGYGWGHGLGMSQWGARGMANSGYTYDQILTHYYQGVSLTAKQ